ncbi:carbohydrate porin [Acinetobacter sp. ANC 4641]|uniref:carbohydrate porin n=1 Tax=Acinetobacter sp. ANC 4641 TaxID=2529847 RepID=UPI001038F2F2|nr:carbohydrate porin [Acinetobacter sp. ANC 4641]TCB10427.1 carbohydrate porin [Acinetobacter sp. ANC 4641]
MLRRFAFISQVSMCSVMVSLAAQSHAADAFSTESPYMLGDWNGQRAALKEQGYDFSLGYTGELANVLDSKNTSSHGTEYSGQVSLGAHLDLNKILGWQDTEAQMTVTERHGRNLSNTSDALNGQLSSVQEVWGRGQTWRLTDFWIKRKFLDQKLDVKVGRFGEAEEFNSFNCDFQNLALCGSQMGNWAGDQWYNWPVSQWAVRVKYQLQPNLFAQAGAFEVNPENLERGKGFNLSTDGSKGALIPVELVWQPKLTAAQLPGEYRLGYFYSTADASKLNAQAQDIANTSAHKQGGWVSVKQQLTTHQGDVNRGLTAWANFTFFDDATNAVTNMQNLAISYNGLFDARPQDEIAVGVGRIHKSAQGYNSEYDAELYYGIHATNWLTVRPNIQYVRHVGALKDGNNAWVGGIKFVTAF